MFGSIRVKDGLRMVDEDVREHGEFVFWATDTEYRPANSERPGCALLGKYYPDQHYAPGTAAADTGEE